MKAKFHLKSCTICKKSLSQTATRYGTTGLCRNCIDLNKKGIHPIGGFLKNHIPFNKGKHLKRHHKKALLEFNHSRKGIPLSEIHRKHISIALKQKHIRGKKHWSYIHGEGHKGYTQDFKNLRPEILKRDNFKCQKCGQYGNYYNHKKNKIEVHHINYNKKHNSKRNLITLCHRCNIFVNKDRDYWYAYFTYLKEKSNVLST